jgi:DMSO/TMAO reductase YedYZ molybdopterin-dependent catalytic subunit
VGGGAALVLTAWETGLDASGAAGGTRRFTGSVEKPRGVPSAMPVTSWLDDAVPQIDPAHWRLQVGNTRLDLAAIRDLPHESVTTTLDCTGGWFAEQDWDGVRLSTVLAAAGVTRAGEWRSLEVRSVTGYARWFGADTLDDVWLATQVGGAELSYGHGFPVRVVAPDRRGFWWVKWVASMQPSSRPAWAQSVFPLT